MKMQDRILVAAMAAVAAAMVGCGESNQIVQISYDRQAKVEIPQNIKRIAIAEFEGTTPRDKRWGDVASDELASRLDEANRKFSRYELVDRKRLKEIMDERDLQMAISDSSAARKIGTIANVQAMIYGSVHVDARDERGTRMVPDFSNPGAMKSVPYTKRYCLVTVSFSMDDINTGKTLTSRVVKKEYDSDDDTKKSKTAVLTKAMGFSGDKLNPLDQVSSNMVSMAVEDFLAEITPHTVNEKAELEKGKSDQVKNGNTFAMAKSYEDALKAYQRGMQLKRDDDGAMFNAGVVCEAMGELKQAEDFYNKALAVKVKPKYIEARNRVAAEKSQ